MFHPSIVKIWEFLYVIHNSRIFIRCSVQFSSVCRSSWNNNSLYKYLNYLNITVAEINVLRHKIL